MDQSELVIHTILPSEDLQVRVAEPACAGCKYTPPPLFVLVAHAKSVLQMEISIHSNEKMM